MKIEMRRSLISEIEIQEVKKEKKERKRKEEESGGGKKAKGREGRREGREDSVKRDERWVLSGLGKKWRMGRWSPISYSTQQPAHLIFHTPSHPCCLFPTCSSFLSLKQP
jgi:hypothetical protein